MSISKKNGCRKKVTRFWGDRRKKLGFPDEVRGLEMLALKKAREERQDRIAKAKILKVIV